MLSRAPRKADELPEAPAPEIATLLDVDAEYRRRARSGQLHRIAPHRFNPHNNAWLPVMHKERDGYDFTLMYSNTQRAHRLGKNNDWVVVEYQQRGLRGRCTIVTETRGPDEYRRVVRGRESECHSHYLLNPEPPMKLVVPQF
jgi:hypothetical protein